MSAPRFTSTVTTSSCPAREEMWSAVFPFCNRGEREEQKARRRPQTQEEDQEETQEKIKRRPKKRLGGDREETQEGTRRRSKREPGGDPRKDQEETQEGTRKRPKRRPGEDQTPALLPSNRLWAEFLDLASPQNPAEEGNSS